MAGAGPRPPPGISLAPSIQTETELEVDSDDEELDGVEETVMERLAGLTEMLPDKVWRGLGRFGGLSFWFVRRSAWVLGTSLALLVLPPLLEQQRVEFEEMHKMHQKQVSFEGFDACCRVSAPPLSLPSLQMLLGPSQALPSMPK